MTAVPQIKAHVILVGHSEGTIIALRIAIDNPGQVDKIVLMAAIAQCLHDVVY